MPTVTIARPDVSREATMQAVRDELGSDYKVAPGGHDDVFSVSRGTMTGAKVHMKQGDGTTEFHVHGTGIIIGRIVNELVFARRVASVLAKALPG